MRNQPEGWTKRAFSALVLLLAIAYGARLASSWLMPLVPVVIVLVVLGVLYAVVFGRRR
jgi:hypothetical protein